MMRKMREQEERLERERVSSRSRMIHHTSLGMMARGSLFHAQEEKLSLMWLSCTSASSRLSNSRLLMNTAISSNRSLWYRTRPVASLSSAIMPSHVSQIHSCSPHSGTSCSLLLCLLLARPSESPGEGCCGWRCSPDSGAKVVEQQKGSAEEGARPEQEGSAEEGFVESDGQSKEKQSDVEEEDVEEEEEDSSSSLR